MNMLSGTSATVLIVDDMPQNISLLNAALMDEYTIRIATSGKQAIQLCRSMPIDIILLDVMMPEMDGFETCRQLKQDPLTRSIPVIFITARGEIKDEALGLSYGAVDYITKPISTPIVRARIKTHLALYDQNRTLEKLVLERTAELNRTRLKILHCLGNAGEYRDYESRLHVVRVCHYSRLIALAYGLHATEAEMLFEAAALHDVGKIGIPDNILLKNGKLNEEEWKVIRSHCEIGYKIIGEHDTDLLATAATIALTHHERWDGLGYPKGLANTEIPLLGRITSVADVFDALTSDRPYKRAWPHEEAVREIVQCRGSSFDPAVVDAFLRVTEEIDSVKNTLGEP